MSDAQRLPPVISPSVSEPVVASSNSTPEPPRRPLLSSGATAPISWHWPSEGPIIHPFQSSAPGRKGIDIAGRAGDPVRAAAAGKVVYSGDGLRGYGNLIIIKHNEKFLSAYAHNQTLLVKEGTEVTSGQEIARMGSTEADQVELYFEIRVDGKPVDPVRYLPKRGS